MTRSGHWDSDVGRRPPAQDNYEYTPLDRLASNSVGGRQALLRHGAVSGRKLPRGAPDWADEMFAYQGPGEYEA